MLKNEFLEILINNRNIKYYKILGIDCKRNDIIVVHYKLVQRCSRINVSVICDYCREEKEISFQEYIKSISGIIPKYACSNCGDIKQREVMLIKYNVKSPLQLESIKEKVKKTNINKYGVENVFQNEEIKQKQRETCEDRYGVENVFKLDSVKQKSKETLLNKLGVEHPMLNDEIKNKVIQKGLETKYKHGTAMCSKQQEYIWNIIGGELNYPIDKLSLDIAYPEDKIYIEYNGSGHDINVKYKKITQNEFNLREIKRYKYLKSLGWKQIIINSPNDLLFEKNMLKKEIFEAINALKQNNKNHININVDDYDNNLLIKI